MRSDNSWFECRSTACGGASSVRPREAARRVSEADQVHFHERNALTRHAHRVPWGASKGVVSTPISSEKVSRIAPPLHCSACTWWRGTSLYEGFPDILAPEVHCKRRCSCSVVTVVMSAQHRFSNKRFETEYIFEAVQRAKVASRLHTRLLRIGTLAPPLHLNIYCAFEHLLPSRRTLDWRHLLRCSPSK